MCSRTQGNYSAFRSGVTFFLLTIELRSVDYRAREGVAKVSLLISENELQERVKNSGVVYKRMGKGGLIDKKGRAGRNKGDKNIIPFVRELIAKDALEGKGTAEEIAEEWNVSESSVNNYKNGRNTNADLKGSNEELAEKNALLDINKLRREKVVNDVTIKLMEAMEKIKTNKIHKEKLPTQVKIVKGLADTLSSLEGRGRNDKDNEGGKGGDVHYHVHIPAPVKIEDFVEVETVEKPMR